ncbi:MAG: cell wall-binding repeat-containing protein [Actinomycetota bacterium]|nr:cell wall-binding repeat-containing protein [Actinomycetota bacterium]
MKRSLIVAAVAAGSLLGAVPGAQADLRVGSNFRLNSDSNAFRGKDQVSLAVDPGNPNHIVEVNANYLTQECEGTTSFDGGNTWTTAVPLRNPAPGAGEQPFAPSCLAGPHLAENIFQTVRFGSGQNVYVAYRLPRTSTVNASGYQGASVLVAKSTDGGQTWQTSVVAMAGGASDTAGPYYALPTLTVDPGQGNGNADRVIVAAVEQTVAFNTPDATNPACVSNSTGPPTNVQGSTRCGDVATTVSNDAGGGGTYSSPVLADPETEDVNASPDGPSQLVINPDHSVSVAWRTQGLSSGVAGGLPAGSVSSLGLVRVARSNPAVTAWTPPVTVTQVTNQGRSAANHLSPSASSGSSFPRLAGGNGNLYIVYNQAGPPTGPGPTCPSPSPCPAGYAGADHFIGPDTDVYFQRSKDLGATWSQPKLINDASPKPGTPITQTRHPDISVAPNGRIDVVWQDRRHWYNGPDLTAGATQQETDHDCIHTHQACDNPRLGDTYYAFSVNQGSTFSADRRISDRSHNNDVGFDYRFGTYWSFSPQAMPMGNNQLLVGWMDSREGSFDSDNQDIYLAKVDHSASNTVPQETLTRNSNGPQFSVDLSRRTYPGGGEAIMAGGFATRNPVKPVIVNEADVPKALAGGVLARQNLGPVLLSTAAGLSDAAKAEVSRLNPVGAYVLGDTGALSAQAVIDLQNAGVPNNSGQIVRLSGADDPATARSIAEAMDRRTAAEKTAGIPAFDAAVIVNPTSPDASAAAGLAAARQLPILFTSADGQSMPASTTTALTNLNIVKTLVIGGTSVISNGAMGGLPSATRLGGANQYETSKAVVAESRNRGLPDNIVYVADGATPMDGALLGAAVGRSTGLELLAPTPLNTTAASVLNDIAPNLSGSVDRLVLVQPAAPGGGGGGGGVTNPGSGLTTTGTTSDTTAPGVSSFGLTNNPFTVGGSTPTFGTAAAKKKGKKHKKGTTFRYTLSEAATVRISISQRLAGRRKGKKCVTPTRKLRKAKKCTRVLSRGTLTRASHVGANSVAFSGRIGSKKLSPGSYLATLIATDAANNSSKGRTISFTIVSR